MIAGLAVAGYGVWSSDDDGGGSGAISTSPVDRSDPTFTTGGPRTTPAVDPSTTIDPERRPPGGIERSDPFAGLGTWVDAFDFHPAHAPDGVPTVVPADVEVMAASGVETLYLQAARPNDPRLGGADLLDTELLGQFLLRAHEQGMAVVAWFLPHHDRADNANDRRHLAAIVGFEYQGHRFDSVALDVEWRDGVADHCERSRRLVELSRWLREATAGQRLAAIVMPPVVTDVLNLQFWPCYPWGEMAALFDVWMPMVYWTNRTADSVWRDAATYTVENIRRLRGHVPGAVIHPVGGIGDQATPGDYEGFLDAASQEGSIGVSIYDWHTQAPDTRALFGG